MGGKERMYAPRVRKTHMGGGSSCPLSRICSSSTWVGKNACMRLKSPQNTYVVKDELTMLRCWQLHGGGQRLPRSHSSGEGERVFGQAQRWARGAAADATGRTDGEKHHA